MRKIGNQLAVAATVAGLAAGCGSSGGGSSSSLSQSQSTSANAQSVFTQVGSLATGRTAHTASWVPQLGKVLVVGGRGRSGFTDAVLDSAELFNPQTGTFEPTQGRLLGNQQLGQNGRMLHSAIVLPSGNVLIVGGQADTTGNVPLNTLEMFNGNASTQQFGPVSGTLTEAKARPTVFEYTTATGDTEVVIAGGSTGSASLPLSSVNYFSVLQNSILSTTGTLLAPNVGAQAAPISAAITSQWVFAGGVTSFGSSQAVAGFEVYDPVARTFSTLSASAPGIANANLFAAVAGESVAQLGASSEVVVVGGRNSVPDVAQAIGTVQFYNASTNAWAPQAASLVTPRQHHTATRLANGDVLVVGGVSSSNQVLATAELISGTGANAQVIPLQSTLHIARKNHTATLIPMQVGTTTIEAVLIVGGEDASGAPVRQAEIFAPGNVTIGVTSGGSTSGAPSLTSITPNNGPVGTAVTISGNNFSAVPQENIVTFAGIVTPVQSASSGTLTVLVPQGATTGDVVVTVDSISSNALTFTINGSTTTGTGTGTTTGSGGQVFSGPPRIFILLPTSGGSFMPLGIGGTNFDTGTIPYINGIPSISLFNFATSQLPLVGAISIGFTVVPPGAPSGQGDVSLVYNGQVSNPFPFTKN